MKRHLTRRGFRPWICRGVLAVMVLLSACSGDGPSGGDEIAVIRPGVETGFSNGGWNLDRYPGLEPLNAGARIVAADLSGPGTIRHIHLTRHHPAEVFARGIVLEIWFVAAATPAARRALMRHPNRVPEAERF